MGDTRIPVRAPGTRASYGSPDNGNGSAWVGVSGGDGNGNGSGNGSYDPQRAGGAVDQFLRRVTPGDWIKIILLLITITMGYAEIKGQIAQLREESRDTRTAIREMQKDLNELKVNQGATTAVVSRLAQENNENHRRNIQ